MKRVFCPHCNAFRNEDNYKLLLDTGAVCLVCSKVIFPSNEKSQLDLPKKEITKPYYGGQGIFGYGVP